MSEGQISEPTTAQYRTVPLRPYNVTFDPLSIGLVEQIIIWYLHITRDLCGLVSMYFMVISNRSWLLLCSVARSHRCFWVWPIPGFLALLSWCLDYANYAHLFTNSLNKYNNDVKRPLLLIWVDYGIIYIAFQILERSHYSQKVAIGIRRKTPQIIERGEDLVASFNENLRPGRTYQVPHHTHISTKHGLAYILLGFKGITAFIMMTLPSLQ